MSEDGLRTCPCGTTPSPDGNHNHDDDDQESVASSILSNYAREARRVSRTANDEDEPAKGFASRSFTRDDDSTVKSSNILTLTSMSGVNGYHNISDDDEEPLFLNRRVNSLQ
jgi:hypothetical protein